MLRASFKSINYKRRYYPISYKLKFILKSSLSIGDDCISIRNTKFDLKIEKCYWLLSLLNKAFNCDLYSCNKFIFKTLKCVDGKVDYYFIDVLRYLTCIGSIKKSHSFE